jgi:hypothetical protein
VIHVYAFAEQLRALPELDGVDGAPLERRQVDGFDAVVSRRARTSDASSLRGDALAHGVVVEALVGLAASVLPVRFGEGAGDEPALGRLLAERSPELRRALDRVRGCVEIGLRIAGDDAARPAPAATGVAYMQGLREVEEERRRTIGALHEELTRLARETRIDAPVPAGLRFSAAYLVDRGALAAARDRTDRFASGNPQLSVLCTGPWAPYSFAEEAA